MRKTILFNLGLLVLMAAIHPGCKKTENELGLSIQPPSDKLDVFYSDTTTVIAYSQLIDSVQSSNTSVCLMGSLKDPVFGTTTSSFYTQLSLSQTAVSFGENPVLDSLVLDLTYSALYGDSTALLTLKVYEMDERIYIDSTYYSNKTVSVKPTLLANKTFIPRVNEDVISGEDTLGPHLRINLSDLSPELGEKLLNASDADLNTQDDFQDYFYGLYLTVDDVTSGGAIVAFNLLGSLTRMRLYYRNDEADSLRYDFIIYNGTARFSHFDHDYSTGDAMFKEQVINGDTSLGSEMCYLQSMAGVRTIIKFPYLNNYYKDGSIVINEARLFLNGITDDTLSMPKSLVIVKSDGKGGYYILGDQLEGADYFGGVYDKENQQCWFRITRTVQEILKIQEPDYGFEVFISGGAVNAYKTVIVGSGPTGAVPWLPEDNRIKLVITYTKLN